MIPDLPMFREGLEPLGRLSAKIERLTEALRHLVDIGDRDTAHKATRLIRTLAGLEPSVTLIGQVKSGKTTLVNAMAGCPGLLPADVNPWTSVVTSLHLAPEGRALGSGARFRFFDADEWDRLLTRGGRIGELAGRAGAERELERIRAQVQAMREKTRARLGRKFELLLGQEHHYSEFDHDLIERYICLGDDLDGEAGLAATKQGRFADITRSADLYLRHDAFPLPLCLRDTPGVNDTFMMREQITIRALRDSRLCVLVLSAHQALTSVDMALIRLISTVKSRDAVIFVNRIDELSDPARQVPEIESAIRQTLKDHNGPVDAQIIFGSAFWGARALQDDIESMPEDCSAALLNWAEASLPDLPDGMTTQETVWELSGIPPLFRILSERIVEGIGRETMDKVSRSALNLANGLRIAGTISIPGGAFRPRIGREELNERIMDLAVRHFGALESALEELAQSYRARLDRAHASFLERATESLVDHLQKKGEDLVWEYDPTGLRMLLRSAYNVFGSATQQAVQKILESATSDLHALYLAAFGDEVKGVQIRTPATHRVPPPVFIGQTIALDFKGNWWSSWWRKWRGYRSLARNFHDLIRAETAPMVGQLKEAQAEELCRAAVGVLDEFLDEQRVILTGIMESCDGGRADAPLLPADGAEEHRRQVLENTLKTLTRYAA